MAKFEPHPKPCPKCGAAVHIYLTGWQLRNWFVLKPDCKCFPEVESKKYWIDNDNFVTESENAYKDLVEAWNRRAEDGK